MTFGVFLLIAVVPDRFHGAALKSLHALGDLFVSSRLLINVGVAPLVVPLEERWRGFATKIAVDTLLIDKEFASRVLGPLVSYISHKTGEQRL
jgi:hypothetical protein